MTKLSATVNNTKCQGYGGCQKAAPAAFRLNPGGKAEVLSSFEVEDDIVLRGARSCPYRAITVTGPDGQQLYPPPRR